MLRNKHGNNCLKRCSLSTSTDIEKRDPYEVLGVSQDDDDDTVKKAYRKLSVKCHPDRFPNDSTMAAKFRELNEAYEAIDTEEKRRRLRQKAGANLSRGAEGAVVSYFARVFQVTQTEGER